MLSSATFEIESAVPIVPFDFSTAVIVGVKSETFTLDKAGVTIVVLLSPMTELELTSEFLQTVGSVSFLYLNLNGSLVSASEVLLVSTCVESSFICEVLEIELLSWLRVVVELPSRSTFVVELAFDKETCV